MAGLVVASTALAGGGASTVPGTWRALPLAPLAIPQGRVSVWTGSEMIVLGRRPLTNPASRVAQAYVPASRTWRLLSPPADVGTVDLTGVKAVWTGEEMLAFGSTAVGYDPTTDTWRGLRRTLPGGIVAWTGRQAIGWGGGCCGDAWSNGETYDPATDAFRKLPRSPLAASQGPLGAWTGRELVLLVSGFDPNERPYPARLARAAAYDPAARSWRRIAPLPESDVPRGFRGNAVWDGRELLVVGAGVRGRSAYAYAPRTNRWRKLAPLPAPLAGATAVWAGRRLFLWGSSSVGLSYDPQADRWSTLPRAPLRARSGAAIQWTGRELIVWGGGIPRKVGAPSFVRDGAAFDPTGS